MSIPAETAAMTPCVSFIPAGKVGQAWEWKKRKYKPPCGPVNKRSPAAIPIGTVVANNIIMIGRRVRELVGRVAIRVPSDRPSNSWWNVTAVAREADTGSIQSQIGGSHGGCTHCTPTQTLSIT